PDRDHSSPVWRAALGVRRACAELGGPARFPGGARLPPHTERVAPVIGALALPARLRPRTWTVALAGTVAWLETPRGLAFLRRGATAGALVGQGGYGAVLAKKEWVGYMAAAGVPPAALAAAPLVRMVGWLEIALGLLVLVRPFPALLVALVAWKV